MNEPNGVVLGKFATTSITSTCFIFGKARQVPHQSLSSLPKDILQRIPNLGLRVVKRASIYPMKTPWVLNGLNEWSKQVHTLMTAVLSLSLSFSLSHSLSLVNGWGHTLKFNRQGWGIQSKGLIVGKTVKVRKCHII